VTLEKGEPYDSWHVVTLAKVCGWRVRNCTPFDVSSLPGYTATARQARVYAFERLPPKVEVEVKKRFGGDAREAKKQRSKKARRP
tara:strand:- start:1480 stop:1734 length:255 start_codon:yes stop_codon:yes gene_type:complete